MLTTLQALDLSNGQLLTDTLARGAANLLKAHPSVTPGQFIEMIYLQALCRQPTAGEQTAAANLLGPQPTSEGFADLLWTIFMLPEFQLVR